MNLTRRHLLRGTGAAALLSATNKMPVLDGPFAVRLAAAQELPAFAAGIGHGRRVAVIGAGIAGLTSAYELLNAGFDVTVYEGHKRYGGRSLTVRPSDSDYKAWYLDNNTFVRADSYCDFVPAEVRGARVGEQTSQFKPVRDGDDYVELYFNAGPGRIPTNHTGVLHYCRKFGVAMEPYIFVSESNLLQSENLNGSSPLQLRRFQFDLQGYIAGMLYGTADQAVGAATAAQHPNMVKHLRSLLQIFGDLAPDGSFVGTKRAGYVANPGAGTNAGIPENTLALQEMLGAEALWPELYFGDKYMWQAALLEPSGGMDMVWQAFLAQDVAGAPLRNRVRLEHEVTDLTYATPNGSQVSVSFRGPDGNGREAYDYVVMTGAPFVTAGMDGNGLIDDQVRGFLRSALYASGARYGWQARRRFWEDLDVGIFGGISWTTHPIRQIWYPSSGYHDPTGVLTGAYMVDFDLVDADGAIYQAATDYRVPIDPADIPSSQRAAYLWSQMDQTARTKLALEGGELLHPGFTHNVYDEDGISISWDNQPFQLGLTVWDMALTRPEAYAGLIRPIDRAERVYLAGDYLSYWPGWQEGAVRSAWWTLGLIRDHVEAQGG